MPDAHRHAWLATQLLSAFDRGSGEDRQQQADHSRKQHGRYLIMKAKQLEMITEQLGTLHGYAYFRPQPGPLRERLTEVALEAIDGEHAGELAEGAFDLEVNVGRQEGDSEITVGFKLDHPAVHHSSQLALQQLDEGELEDLGRYLARLAEKPVLPESAEPGKNIVRKNQLDEAEHHEKGAAAARLKVSPEWLKSVVPCTDYSYDEIEGKKYIREYYWSQELIERLVKIKSTKTTPEDLQYVATECCHGDLEWAKDLIARLKSPNRPEPAAKGQPQRGEARQGSSRPPQAKQPQAKPPQGSAVQVQEKAAAAKPAAGKAAQPQAAPGERPGRSRSRHRRPFRQQGADARKPQPAGGEKPPQQ